MGYRLQNCQDGAAETSRSVDDTMIYPSSAQCSATLTVSPGEVISPNQLQLLTSKFSFSFVNLCHYII